ncbi:MAG: hypothetical protein IPK27_03415 [Rhodanobacteraceae bacterium]|nr:hypothetical protein [Rhodanobacteraceae bacterium]
MRKFVSWLPLALCLLYGCSPAGMPAQEAAPDQPVLPTVAPAALPRAQEPEAPSPQSEAQAYLDRAREAAEQRHRDAMASCESASIDRRDLCIQSAEDGLLAEMRAARVEYDARMSQPE